MKQIFLLFLSLASLSSAIATHTDNPIESCKGDPHEAYCSAKVILEALQKLPGTGTVTGPPKCKCMCGGPSASKTCSLYYIDGENSGILASEISPRECVEALRYPPCRD